MRTALRRLLLTVLTALVLPVHLFAQTTATAASKFVWDEPGQTAAVAQAASYNLYNDGSTTAAALTGETCVTGTPTSQATCTVSIPAYTPGPHTATVTQVISGAESAKSNSISFTFVVVVTPSGLRMARGLIFWHGGIFASRGRDLLKRQHVYPVR